MPPQVSVIIPAYRAQRTLPLVLGALEPQIVPGAHEALIVQTGMGGAAPVHAGREWLRVVTRAERMFPAQARNLGAALAGGELLVFLDADAIPEPGWLAALVGALRPGIDVVAGAVLNGTPANPWGTTGYLLEFLEWVPGRLGPLEHAAACSLLVCRPAFERLGGFPEDVWPGEDTLFTVGPATQGALAFAPDAQVRHLNRTCPRTVLSNQTQLGTGWVEICARVRLPGARLATARLAPVAVAGRLWAIVKHSHRYGTAALLWRHFPLVLAGLAAWGIGVWRSARGRSDTGTRRADT